MFVLILIPSFLSALLLAAHFFRNEHYVLVLMCCGLPWLLVVKRMWAVRLLQIMLVVGALEWVRALFEIRARRMDEEREWVRMAVILGAVAAFTAMSALLLFLPQIRRIFGRAGISADHYSSVA
jgi:hypothetical protein